MGGYREKEREMSLEVRETERQRERESGSMTGSLSPTHLSSATLRD